MKKYAYIFTTIVFTILTIISLLAHPIMYKENIIASSKKYKLDPAMIYAVINTESGFDSNAISSVGACGLMQIMPNTAVYIIEKYHLNIDIDNLFLPATNIELGCAYLHYLSKKFKERKWVLAAYNAGETVVKNWIDNGHEIRYKETKNYIKKVEKNILIYKSHILANV